MFLNNLYFHHFIPDIINSILFLIFLIYLHKKYYLKKNLMIILSILIFTPFLFYFLFPWDFLPDQSKYAYTIYGFRNFNYNNDKFLDFLITSRVDFSSLLYSFFPLPFVTTIISVSLINKGILYVIILYFLNKKKYFLIYLLLFLPSMIFFSSVALREILVISVGIIFIYFFFEKKYVKSLFFAVILLLIKPYFGILCLSLFVSYYYFFIKLNLKVLNKIALSWFMLAIIFLFIMTFFFQDLLISFRNGFYSEEFRYKLLPRSEVITLFTVLNSFIQFFLSPLSTKEFNLWTIIIFIENLFLLYLAIILLKKIYKKNQCKAIFWILCWLILFATHGFVIFNAGTIWRYKFVIQIVMVSAMYFSLNNKNRHIY